MNIVLVDPIGVTANITARTLVRPEMPSLGAGPESLRETKIVELATELARRGHRATVLLGDVFLGRNACTLPDGVRILPLGTVLHVPFHPGLVPATPALLGHPALADADVVQVGEFHQPSTYLACAAAGLVVPVVVWQETFHRMRFPGSLYQRAFESTVGRFVRARGKGFVPRTTKARAYLRELRVAEDRIGPWIPTGIDVSAFAPRRSQASAEDFGWPPDARVLLLVARLHPTKGVDLALRALKWLIRRDPAVRLLIRGSGPERDALVQLARDLGVDRFVRVLDHKPRAEMVELYNLSEVVLNTSRVDLLPFSLMEASACGRPCVAMDVGAIPDIVVDGDTGLLVRERTEEALGFAIRTLLRDDALRHALGSGARDRATQRFSLATVGDQLLEVYRNVAA